MNRRDTWPCGDPTCERPDCQPDPHDYPQDARHTDPPASRWLLGVDPTTVPAGRYCARCGDTVQYLSGDDLCDGCAATHTSTPLGAAEPPGETDRLRDDIARAIGRNAILRKGVTEIADAVLALPAVRALLADAGWQAVRDRAQQLDGGDGA